MLLTDGVELFLEHRRLRGLALASRDVYRRWLTGWLDWRAKQHLRPEIGSVEIGELRAFFAYLRDRHVPHQSNRHRPAVDRVGLAPSSIEGCYRVLRAFWRFLADEDLLVDNQAGYFRSDRIPRPRVQEQIRPACDRPTLNALLFACGDGFDDESARNRAILLLLFESGMRVSELCSLTDRDVQLTQQRAIVTGKGNKQRWVFWGERAAAALARYLRLRRGRVGGPVLRGMSVRNNGGAMTPDAIRSLMKRIAAGAGVALPNGSPIHWLRHGFAHTMLDDGADISQVQQLMGHADIKTTARYLGETPERLQAIHRRVFGKQKTGGDSHGVHESRRRFGGRS